MRSVFQVCVSFLQSLSGKANVRRDCYLVLIGLNQPTLISYHDFTR